MKTTYQQITFIVIIILLFTNQLYAQIISGKITDSETNEPIPYVNVYFAGSLIGTRTGEDGSFALKNTNAGRFDLVVSHVGYKDSIQTITVRAETKVIINIALIPESTLLNEIAVNADTTGWYQNYLYFKMLFLGESKNASQTDIINPRILSLFFDKSTRTLSAHAKEELEIENQALGYKIFFKLEYFEMNQRSGLLYSYGIPRFEEITPKNKRQAKKWKKAREMAYYGSFEHFIDVIKADQIKDEGYLIQEIFRIKNPNRPPQDVIDQKLRYFRDRIQVSSSGEIQLQKSPLTDSLRYWNRVSRFNEHIDSLGRVFDQKIQLMPTQDTINYQGALKVIYLNEPEDPRYAFSTRVGGVADRKQTSIIRLLNPYFVSYENGYYDVRSILFEQYIGWQGKIAEMLPLGYMPDK